MPLGNGMNISRQHAKIVFNFGTQRFELIILGKNGVHIGETHLVPQSPPYPLKSQELLLIGDRLVYFLLPKKAHAEALIAATKGACGGTTPPSVQAPPFQPAAAPTPSIAHTTGSTGASAGAGAMGDGGATKRPRVETPNAAQAVGSMPGHVGQAALMPLAAMQAAAAASMQQRTAAGTLPVSMQLGMQRAPMQQQQPAPAAGTAFPGMLQQQQQQLGQSPVGMGMGGLGAAAGMGLGGMQGAMGGIGMAGTGTGMVGMGLPAGMAPQQQAHLQQLQQLQLQQQLHLQRQAQMQQQQLQLQQQAQLQQQLQAQQQAQQLAAGAGLQEGAQGASRFLMSSASPSPSPMQALQVGAC